MYTNQRRFGETSHFQWESVQFLKQSWTIHRFTGKYTM